MLKLESMVFIALFIANGWGTNYSYANTDTGPKYPDEIWSQYQTAEQAGFIPNRLEKVKKFYNKKAFAGLLVVKDGAVAIDWGQNNRRLPVHSIRKSMLSALYGMHLSDIDLKANLMALGIDDNGRLTEQERLATMFDVLASRSGVYLPAAAEGGEMVRNRPNRGSHTPGSYWWYNNWDFNVAGTLYRQLTGEEIFASFKQHLADPLQMQDYRDIDGYYVKAESEHHAFQFRMSSRDLARLGLLYARQGLWQGQQVLPQEWITQSTKALSQTDMGSKYPPAYGMMWWVDEDGSFSARGAGGHILAVYPEKDMVVVLRTDTYLEHSVSAQAIQKILGGILSASEGRAKTNPTLQPSEISHVTANILPKQYQNQSASMTLETGQTVTLYSNDKSMFVNYGTGDLELAYLDGNHFYLADTREPLLVEWDEAGQLADIKTPRLFYLRAGYAAKNGDIAKAQQWVEQVIAIMPDSAIAYTNLAKLLMAQGELDVAKDKLNMALRLDPNNKQAQNLKATLLVKQWLVPSMVALGAGLLVFVIVLFRKRKLAKSN